MGFPSLPKASVAEPSLSAQAFQQRCLKLAGDFAGLLARDKSQIAFTPEIASQMATMTLGGNLSEVIERNTGKARVVPLCGLGDDVFAWAGYRERWKKESTEQNFRFMDGGFTIYVGREGELDKPQVLRSEWIGQRNLGFGNAAGHPHWQMDVLESARLHRPSPPARFDDPVGTQAAEEFGSQAAAQPNDILIGLTVERVHLASAALWWKQPSVPIAHALESVAELDRWLLGCVSYLRQEMGRCVIVATPK